MPLPRRRPKPEKRESRWRCPAHTKWVSEFECCFCGSQTNVVAAHYRIGSGAGAGQKPDDWRTTPLCDGPYSSKDGTLGCHQRQHAIGEPTFWAAYERHTGQSVEQLIDELSKASPRAAEIRKIKQERSQ